MNDFAALMAGLDGLSIIIGLAVGFIAALLLNRLDRRSVLKQVSERLGDEVKVSFENVTETIQTSVKTTSSEALRDNQAQFLQVANEKLADQRDLHSSELESKKELIDTQLGQMSETLKTVPTELEKNQKNVNDALDKSTSHLRQSNEDYLNQLVEKSETQSKEHQKELQGKKELIDLRLTNMDVKLGKVERLVSELQTDRAKQYSALDEQLKSLTNTTSSLQRALADNRARGQWGERMAEDILTLMGLVKGVNYIKQSANEEGSRPDFTILFPDRKSLNMDVKFPLDNYLRYIEAETDADRKSFSQKFLRDVNHRVTEVQNRGYISTDTLDCVLIFIPNEQIYRFVHQEDQAIIDNALRNKVILCSPLTLYVVLAVIRQAAQNFNIEQRSREVVDIVQDIRKEWGNYTGAMDKLERRFKGMHDDFHALTGTRTRQMDRKFVKIDGVIKSSDVRAGNGMGLPQLPEETR